MSIQIVRRNIFLYIQYLFLGWGGGRSVGWVCKCVKCNPPHMQCSLYIFVASEQRCYGTRHCSLLSRPNVRSVTHLTSSVPYKSLQLIVNIVVRELGNVSSKLGQQKHPQGEILSCSTKVIRCTTARYSVTQCPDMK